MCDVCDCEVQSLLSTRYTDFDVESLPSDRSTDSYSLDDFRRGPEHWKPDAVWTAALAAARFIAKYKEHRKAPTAHPEQTWIVFDWDDTLMPTSFLDDLERMMPKRGLGQRQGSKQAGLPRDCPCFAAMERHADRVRSILRTARSLGNVAIVTMAERPWVPESASQYLPGLDLEVLLSELDIPILYGPEFMGSMNSCDTSVPEGEGDVYVASKCAAMLDFLKQGADSPCNLISIGDSTIEKHAAKQASRTLGAKNPQSLCKTVKLLTDPSLKELSSELEIVQMWLERLARHFQPVDVDAETVEELESTVQRLLVV
ncbi:mtpn [Symbiodinium natans]|uniref:Mtpn protein n=1 Tax=Symbiodinium natans TaxID=878477 RepID=A0A812QMU8_9DINO|nr:mtpn [Symbiodinium natans]